MITIKTSEATPTQLNYLVAEAEGLRPFVRPKGIEVLFSGVPRRVPFFPSTDWSQGGPIIEREKMDVKWVGANNCRAVIDWLDEEFTEAFGPTPLIAAMRCYCYAKLGDEIDIPDELQPCQQPNL